MGKYVVYVRARDERELEDAGLDVGDWVRDTLKQQIDEKIAEVRSGPAAESGQRTSSTSKARSTGDFQPDFRPRDLK